MVTTITFACALGENSATEDSPLPEMPLMRVPVVLPRFGAHPLCEMSVWAVVGCLFQAVECGGNAVAHWGARPVCAIHDQLFTEQQNKWAEMIHATGGAR